MYIQITTRCNMTCAHCLFACTAKGHDMTPETFKAALALAKEHDSAITIGGGEPTLHPLFKDFLLQAVWELGSVSESNGFPAVAIITNGSQTETAIRLAQLAKAGVIHAAVSRDQYHDEIDEKVVRAFTKEKKLLDGWLPARRDDGDYREVRGEIYNVIPQGRAKSWGNREMHGQCCGGIFCTPKGTLYPCECHRNPLGTVFDPHSVVSDHFSGGYCYKSEEYRTEVLPQIQSYHEWHVTNVSQKRGELVPA